MLRCRGLISGISHISAFFDVETDSQPEDCTYLHETTSREAIRLDSSSHLHRWRTSTGAFPRTVGSFTIYQ